MRLRRKLLNRLARRLNRLSHAMDGEDVMPPGPPKYGDLRLHVDPKAVKEFGQKLLAKEEAKRRIKEAREQRAREDEPSTPEEKEEDEKQQSNTDENSMSTIDQLEEETSDGAKERKEQTPASDGDEHHKKHVTNGTKLDEQRTAPENAPSSPAKEESKPPNEPAKPQTVPSSQLDYDMEILRDYKDAYEKKVYRSTGAVKYAVLDQEVEEDHAAIKYGAGIGASHRSMSSKEKELEWKRWQIALLGRVPDQPTFKELGLEDRVFMMQERLDRLEKGQEGATPRKKRNKRKSDVDAATPNKWKKESQDESPKKRKRADSEQESESDEESSDSSSDSGDEEDQSEDMDVEEEEAELSEEKKSGQTGEDLSEEHDDENEEAAAKTVEQEKKTEEMDVKESETLVDDTGGEEREGEKEAVMEESERPEDDAGDEQPEGAKEAENEGVCDGNLDEGKVEDLDLKQDLENGEGEVALNDERSEEGKEEKNIKQVGHEEEGDVAPSNDKHLAKDFSNAAIVECHVPESHEEAQEKVKSKESSSMVQQNEISVQEAGDNAEKRETEDTGMMGQQKEKSVEEVGDNMDKMETEDTDSMGQKKEKPMEEIGDTAEMMETEDTEATGESDAKLDDTGRLNKEEEENEGDDDDDYTDEEDDKKEGEENDDSNDDSNDEEDKDNDDESKKTVEETVIPERKKSMSLAAVPSFYDQDLRRIRLIHADLMATSIHEHARQRIADATNDYNYTFRRSNEFYNRRGKVQAELNSILYEARLKLSKMKNNYALDVALARSRWQKRKEAWDAQKMQKLLPSTVGAPTIGTPLTAAAASMPDPVLAQVAATLSDVVDGVAINAERGWKIGEFEPFVPPPLPSLSAVLDPVTGQSLEQRYDLRESTLRAELNALTVKVQSSEDDRKRAWKKMLKTRAEFELPNQQWAGGSGRRGRQVDPNQLQLLPVPPLRASAPAVAPTTIGYTSSVPAYIPPASTSRTPTVARAPYGTSNSKYSIVKVKERIAADGTVAPVTSPKKNKDGLFQRPAGRTRKGMNWDAVRGIWVPAAGGGAEGGNS